MFESLVLAGVVGVVTMLWQINRQLACIKNELKHIVGTQQDHEQRIRKLESK